MAILVITNDAAVLAKIKNAEGYIFKMVNTLTLIIFKFYFIEKSSFVESDLDKA